MDFLAKIRTRAAARRIDGYHSHWKHAGSGQGLFAQHDYSIANSSGAAVRSDLNDALSAVVTWNSGASAPGTTFARMRWADTTAGVIKRRNAANSAWIVESTNDETFFLSRATNTVLGVSDIGKGIRATGSFTQTFSAVATLTDGWAIAYRIEAGYSITFDPNSTETIDGGTTKVIAGPASGLIYCDGSALYTVGFSDAAATAQTLVDAATVAWDVGLGNVASVTLGGNRTFGAPTGLKVGTYVLHVIQDGTGSRTGTWNAVFKWPGAVAPVLSTGAGKRDVFSFISDGTNLYGSWLLDVR